VRHVLMIESVVRICVVHVMNVAAAAVDHQRDAIVTPVFAHLRSPGTGPIADDEPVRIAVTWMAGMVQKSSNYPTVTIGKCRNRNFRIYWSLDV
jgi:hypothetical protein